MKKPREKIIVGRHTWHAEVKPWAKAADYETWKAEVCGGLVAREEALQEFHAAQWDAADCREYMLIAGMLRSPQRPRERVVTLEVDEINRRFALCLWRECSKLLTRRMTPEARTLVCDMQARMEKQAGIERANSAPD